MKPSVKKNILITGANGFVGSHLCEEALRKGWKVIAGVRKGSDLKYIQELKLEYVYLDFNHPEKVVKNLEYLAKRIDLDYVIHNAGVTRAPSPEKFYEINGHQSGHFFEVLKSIFPTIKKVLLISSLAVNGPGSEDMTPIHRHDAPRPISPYGESKRLGEEYLRKSGLPYIILRPTAIYGPRESKMLTLIKMMKKGVLIDIFPSRQRLSFVHVADLACLSIRALAHSCVSETFLVSDGAYYNMQEYQSIVQSELDLKYLRIPLAVGLVKKILGLINKIAHIGGKTMHVTPEKIEDITSLNWNPDIRETTEILGFEPQYNLNRGLADSIRWYKDKRWL